MLGQRESAQSEGCCVLSTSVDAQVKPPLVMELQPPVLSNNWGNLSETCMLDDTFKALVRPIVVSLTAFIAPLKS